MFFIYDVLSFCLLNWRDGYFQAFHFLCYLMAFDSVEVASLNIPCGYFELGVFQQVDAFYFMNHMTAVKHVFAIEIYNG